MNIEDLGRKIRRERRALGLTIERLAELTGTSKANLQRIETGAKSPSVALLAEISHVLRKPIGDFIGERGKGFYKIDGIKRKTLITDDFRMSTICPFGLINRDIVVNYFKAKAGALVKPHQDKGYEWIYIVGGSCIFEHDGKSYRLAKGDVIYYDARRTHSVKTLTPLESIDIFVRT